MATTPRRASALRHATDASRKELAVCDRALDAPRYRSAMRLWTVMQTELAGLSSDAAHVVALHSDHFVQNDQPDVVSRAVSAVVRSIRDQEPLPPCEQLFAGPDARCLS